MAIYFLAQRMAKTMPTMTAMTKSETGWVTMPFLFMVLLRRMGTEWQYTAATRDRQ